MVMNSKVHVVLVGLASFLLGLGVAWCVWGRGVSWSDTGKSPSPRVDSVLRRRLEPFRSQVDRIRQRSGRHGEVASEDGGEKTRNAEPSSCGRNFSFLTRLPDGGVKIDFEGALDAGVLEEQLIELQRSDPGVYRRLVDEIDEHIAENAMAASNRLATLSAFPEDLFRGDELDNHGALLSAVARVAEAHRALNGYHESRLSPDERIELCEESGRLSQEIQERLEIERTSLFRTLVEELGYGDGDADDLVSVLNAVVDVTMPCPEADEVTVLSDVVLAPEASDSVGGSEE